MKPRLVTLADAESAWPWATRRYLRLCVDQRRLPFKKIANRIWFDASVLDAHEQEALVDAMTPRHLTRRFKTIG